MLGGIFHKRKKAQDLRAPSLHDLKKFRDAYAKYADFRQVETPSCFEKSIYKAISGQKEIHSVEYKQEDITDPQMIALAEALLEMPMISSLDLRDNRITDDGAKALLEVLRQQIIAAKTPPPSINPRTKQPIHSNQAEFTRYVTHVNLKGNEVSSEVVEEFSQYVDILRREDKRLEIRAALNRIDRNSDGGIDEEEFKGVLKLLTASTPTKKEVRAFMQQHTLSTDSAQNVINLENVLLAKCATSPSRKAASPPWESLVQERHAILGPGRMASPDPPSPLPPTARSSHPSLPSSSNNHSMVNASPYFQSSSSPEVSPLSAALAQPASVAPLEMLSTVTKPPPAPVSAQPIRNPEAKARTSSAEQLPAPTKPTIVIPTLPLGSLTQPSVNPSPRSARSHTGTSFDDESQRPVSSARDGATINAITSAASSPHQSEVSDNISVVSSAFGGSISHTRVDAYSAERKSHAPSISEAAIPVLDSPRWQTDHLSLDDDDLTSSSGLSGVREAEEELNSGNGNDDGHSVYSRGDAVSATPRSVVTSASASNEFSDNKSVLSGQSRRNLESEALRDLPPSGNYYPSNERDEKRPQPANSISTPTTGDLSSLVYRGMEDGPRTASNSTCNMDNSESLNDQPEENEEVDDRVESVVVDVIKDGKERAVIKLIHPEFRAGLPVKEFPGVPFRNLLAILLPENCLSDLALFADCRFPFALVLDLSKNRLTKVADDALVPFPRLEVLNLANNQLKAISGTAKTLKLRALNVSHNGIRAVKNVEHLVQLEVLQLAGNLVATVHALRLLSLNKMLVHLNLDGNPVVVTDERQRRKNIVHVRNLLPMLQTLGSIPCLNVKKKANSGSSSAKSLFDSELLSSFQSLWVSTACSLLQISQDAVSTHNASHSEQDDDAWDTRDEDDDASRPRKPLTRDQQRQKDEMRSRAIGFRSRGKAIPSPPKAKTSTFCFGPPQPPPIKKKKKKPAPADPSIVKEQRRRASELSAPKHPPVDQTLMRQEQKRKSRVDYHGSLTVAERLQLASEMAQRRPTISATTRPRSMLPGKRASTTTMMTTKEEPPDTEGDPDHKSGPRSPKRPSPLQDAVVFRIDPADTPRSPKDFLSFRVDPNPIGMDKPTSKEATFLHDLAVTDFLTHAEEELSTALTALNVLLSMSEKEQADRKKLADYRTSLDTLDILNESESEDMFRKTLGHPDHDLQAQCTEWFTKLGVVKKCMRQILEKLDGHAPGSGVIRAFCRHIRTNELRGIITNEEAEDAAMEGGTESPKTATNNLPQGVENEYVAETKRQDAGTNIAVSQQVSVPPSAASRIDESVDHDTSEDADVHFSGGDSALDFLEPTTSAFDDETETQQTSEIETQDQDDLVLYAATTDITMDIQMNEVPDALNNNDVNEAQEDGHSWSGDADKENYSVDASEAVAEEDGINHEDESIDLKSDGYEAHEDDSGEPEQDHTLVQSESVAAQGEDYDWLGSSTDLDAEVNAGSFETEMAAVSDNEAETEGEVAVEATETDQNYDWSVTEEETIEDTEEVAYDENCAPEESGVQEDGDYNTEENPEELAIEETEAGEAQYELAEGEDADDEEAETFGDWEKGFDPNSNHYFWFNHTTGESSWTPPEGWPYEVDEPFSSESYDATADEITVEGEEDGETVEYSATEEQEYAEEQEYDANIADDRQYDEGPAEEQEYDYTAEEGQYEDGATEEQQYTYETEEGQQYNESEAAEGQYYENEEQQYEYTTEEGQAYEEDAEEGTDHQYASDDQPLDQEVEDRHSEGSDFEFDDTDLPTF